MANLDISKVRNAFSNQRAQCIIVDLADMPVHFLNNFSKAVEDILTLACSIRGATRIPLFALTVLRKTPVFIYELDLVRANYHKIIAALHSLATYREVGLDIKDFENCLYVAIEKCVNLFNFKLENNELNIDVNDLELTIITVKDTNPIKSYLKQISLEVDTERVHKITVIQLKDCDITALPTVPSIPDFIETFVTTGNTYHPLENYFKHWLIEHADNVDVILHLPGPDKQNFSLQCDIYECQLNPLSLPFGYRVYVQLDCLSVQMHGMSVAKTAPATVPVYEFNIVARVESSKLCDSAVYGTPLCLRPSQCSKLQLADRKMNEEHFVELCNQLMEQNLVLLAQMKSQSDTDQFMPYFVLTPGNNCFLLKCFASGDLAVPWRRQSKVINTSDETSARIFVTLQNVSLMKDIDPDTMDSGLLRALSSNLNQNKPESTQDTWDEFLPKRFKRAKQ